MLISIIIPCYNAKSYLPECIDSALQQVYKSIEIIVVDNNSTDDTLIILEQYQKKYPSIIRVYTEKKQGAPAARNKGLLMAKGDWIQFLDADDIIYPKKIKEQVELIHSSLDCDLIISNYCYKISESETVKIAYIKTDLWQSLLRGRLGITSSNLWRKEKIEQVGGWNENMNSSQEYDLLFKLLKVNANVIFDSNFNTLVRRQLNSISNSSANQHLIWRTLINQRLQVKDFLKNTHPLYYKKNETLIDQVIIEHLSHYGIYDLKEALKIYLKHINVFTKLTKPTNGRFHQYVYNIFGFKWGTILYRKYLNLLKIIGKYHY